MSDRDTTAPRIIPPDRAAKVEHVRHAIRAAHVDWEAIAGRLAGVLQSLAPDHIDCKCARAAVCSRCRHAHRAREVVLAEFERAKEGT